MSSSKGDKALINKFEQLKRRVHDMEQDNTAIQSKLSRAQKQVKRLRMERIVLLEQLDEYYANKGLGGSDSDDSDASIQALLSDPRMKRHVRGKKRKRHGAGSRGVDKKRAGRAQDSTPGRKKKDPNAPKGPGNVFFLYCRMERENFKDEAQTENLGEVTRLLGQKWKAMSDQEKKKYYDVYDKEQEEYRKAMKSYTEAGGGDAGRIAVEEMTRKDKEEEEGDGKDRPIKLEDADIDRLVQQQQHDDDDQVEAEDEEEDEDEDDEDDLDELDEEEEEEDEEDDDDEDDVDDDDDAASSMSIDPPSALSMDAPLTNGSSIP
ncbi:hypothetical protein BC940DRAFT_311238 [Gongronella butleri]|nr:hypothetical protein BC940DRAFT_311238 [Gongronella butleri]